VAAFLDAVGYDSVVTGTLAIGGRRFEFGSPAFVEPYWKGVHRGIHEEYQSLIAPLCDRASPSRDLLSPTGAGNHERARGVGRNYGPTTDHAGRIQCPSTVNHGHQREVVHARQPSRPYLGVEGSRVQISPTRPTYCLVRGIFPKSREFSRLDPL
jgi:hypothetical protein